MKALLLLVVLELALALNAQDSILDRHAHIFLFDLRQFSLEEELLLVLGDDLCFHVHATRDGVGQWRGVQRQHAGCVGLQPLEEVAVAQEAVLDHLGVARAHLPRRQRSEHRQVRQDESGLMEGADQVLAPRRVDGGLAAD